MPFLGLGTHVSLIARLLITITNRMVLSVGERLWDGQAGPQASESHSSQGKVAEDHSAHTCSGALSSPRMSPNSLSKLNLLFLCAVTPAGQRSRACAQSLACTQPYLRGHAAQRVLCCARLPEAAAHPQVAHSTEWPWHTCSHAMIKQCLDVTCLQSIGTQYHWDKATAGPSCLLAGRAHPYTSSLVCLGFLWLERLRRGLCIKGHLPACGLNPHPQPPTPLVLDYSHCGSHSQRKRAHQTSGCLMAVFHGCLPEYPTVEEMGPTDTQLPA